MLKTRCTQPYPSTQRNSSHSSPYTIKHHKSTQSHNLNNIHSLSTPPPKSIHLHPFPLPSIP
ncbi:hypothetical protein GQ44DRAFT_701505, partial [Phaeosphaeriaceae sp. PMI808]